MKALKLLLTALLLGGTMFVTPSCGKYEEGPGFTLLTKKMRLKGEWKAKEYYDADSGVTVAYNSDEYVTFEKDGTYRYTYGSLSVSGTWDFSDDKEMLRTTYNGVTYEETILRLTNKELWTKDNDGNIKRFEAR